MRALARGQAAIERGRAVSGGTTRDREYLSALAHFYTSVDTIDHVDRVLAYERAMAQLHARYPEDSEAAVFYALALLGSAASLPPDKTYARQKQLPGGIELDERGVGHGRSVAERAIRPVRLDAVRMPSSCTGGRLRTSWNRMAFRQSAGAVMPVVLCVALA